MTTPDQGSPRRRTTGLVIAVMVAAAGAIWTLQGAGILTAGTSFMIGDPRWVAIGLAFVAIGAWLGWRATRVRP